MNKEKIRLISNHVVSAENSREIADIAKKRQIQFPSEHLGFFTSIYAEIETPNLNKIRLGREGVEKALPSLIGSQVNFSHLQAGFIMGAILDAWINENDEIVVTYSMYKEIYPLEYAQSIELAKTGQLSVSFELLSETDTQELLADGTIRVNDFTFIGMGHLMSEDPACPKAKIFDFASKCKERLTNIKERDLVFASKIEEKCNEILNADKWSSDIYNNFPNSSFAVVEPAFLDGITGDKKARHLAFKDRDGKFNLTNYRIALDKVNEILPVTDSITTEELREVAKEELDKFTDIVAQVKNEDKLNQGGNTHMELTEEQKAKVEKIRAELGDFAKEVTDEDLLDDSVVAELRTEKESKEAEEATEEEASEETSKTEKEGSEEASDEASKETEEEKKAKELAFKIDSVEIRTFSLEEKDGVEVVVESLERMTVTDFNAMKEAQAKVTELESTLEAKNSEIETVRETATKIAETKAQLKDNEFAKDFSDEDYLDDEKVAKAIQDQKDAKVIAERKEELKDNDYAKDFSDEDLLNEDKVELAKVKQEKDELKAKVPTEEIQATIEADPEMETGEAEDESKSEEIMASIRKDNTETRESQKVYERQE